MDEDRREPMPTEGPPRNFITLSVVADTPWDAMSTLSKRIDEGIKMGWLLVGSPQMKEVLNGKIPEGIPEDSTIRDAKIVYFAYQCLARPNAVQRPLVVPKL